MNQLALNFTYSDIQIRTITTALDEIWFVGKDVAVALGHKNPERAIRKFVDEDDRRVTAMVTLEGEREVNREMVFINEPGVYSLIFASQTEGANKFKHWVTHEVLPSIRKQGYYSLMSDEQLMETLLERPQFREKLKPQELRRIANRVRLRQVQEKEKAKIDPEYRVHRDNAIHKWNMMVQSDPNAPMCTRSAVDSDASVWIGMLRSECAGNPEQFVKWHKAYEELQKDLGR